MNDKELLRPLSDLVSAHMGTDWAEYMECDEPLSYTVAGSIGQAAVDAFEKGESLEAFAQMLERSWALATGNQENLLIVGLIEAAQNRLSGTRDKYEKFATHLLPESRKQWDELTDYWNPPK